MRAYVLARKGVLASNPDVQNMSRAQWVFEYVSLKKHERDQIDTNAKILKYTLVSVLGLNAIRPEDEHNIPKKWEEMSQDEKEAFLPLVAWVGRPELLQVVKKQKETEIGIEQALNDLEYEELVARIDEAGGDMEPILGIPKSAQQDNVYPGEVKPTESVVTVESDE